MAKIIGITGGIGSGKSVVCRCMQAMGYLVYDCDKRAKSLMDGSPEIKRRLREEISPEAVSLEGIINRPALAAIVFNDKEKLAQLNAIVHGAVREDMARWMRDHSNRPVLFVESAIMFQSGLDKLMDEIWEVTAPIDLRIDRVCKRNGITAEEVKARIAAQNLEGKNKRPDVKTIFNDERLSILSQINETLKSL